MKVRRVSCRQHPLKFQPRIIFPTRNFNKFVNSSSSDELEYFPRSNRQLSRYQHYFFSMDENIDLKMFLHDKNESYKKLSVDDDKESKRWNVLDCGAGQGCALNQLLDEASPGQSGYVRSATGISLHSFPSIHSLLAKHHGVLHWHQGDAVKVLDEMMTFKEEGGSEGKRSRYNLITDVWGAYYYSPHRHLLLYYFYNLLAPRGRAYIFIGGNVTLVTTKVATTKVATNEAADKDETSSEEQRVLETIATEKWPTIFRYGNYGGPNGPENYKWLLIEKGASNDPEIDVDNLASDIKSYLTSLNPISVVYSSIKSVDGKEEYYPSLVTLKGSASP
jgi:hypothetical protein